LRRNANGIAARSRRGSIGSTWWSKRFVVALERIADPARLGRGRIYARSGQVSDLDVARGVVFAQVMGHQDEPYQVSLEVDPIPEHGWAEIEKRLADHAGHAAMLLAGTMPDEIESLFTDAGYPLFPRRASDLRTECSCSDWTRPCKHTAATLFILAEAFDEDPFLILAWRGRERRQLLDRLGALREAEPTPPAPISAAEPRIPIAVADFWSGAPLVYDQGDRTPWHKEAGVLVVDGLDRSEDLVALIEQLREAEVA
jgi:uncharacterized Zn finger protein